MITYPVFVQASPTSGKRRCDPVGNDQYMCRICKGLITVISDESHQYDKECKGCHAKVTVRGYLDYPKDL